MFSTSKTSQWKHARPKLDTKRGLSDADAHLRMSEDISIGQLMWLSYFLGSARAFIFSHLSYWVTIRSRRMTTPQCSRRKAVGRRCSLSAYLIDLFRMCIKSWNSNNVDMWRSILEVIEWQILMLVLSPHEWKVIVRDHGSPNLKIITCRCLL